MQAPRNQQDRFSVHLPASTKNDSQTITPLAFNYNASAQNNSGMSSSLSPKRRYVVDSSTTMTTNSRMPLVSQSMVVTAPGGDHRPPKFTKREYNNLFREQQ